MALIPSHATKLPRRAALWISRPCACANFSFCACFLIVFGARLPFVVVYPGQEWGKTQALYCTSRALYIPCLFHRLLFRPRQLRRARPRERWQALDRNVFAERLPGRNHGASIASFPRPPSFQRFQFDPLTHFSRRVFGCFPCHCRCSTSTAGLHTEVALVSGLQKEGVSSFRVPVQIF